ncbi:hypothetical protein G7085_11445 [Tessaracoccus sp. HDW20]|nr:hypothetical protein [Tessaracoccus coleopterorum]
MERVLEEIYYYEVRPGRGDTEGMALQRIYPSPAGDIDVCAEVHSRDVVIMPFGYHGPSVAAPATTCTTSTSWRARPRTRPG